jgi:hypothetical protein
MYFHLYHTTFAAIEDSSLSTGSPSLRIPLANDDPTLAAASSLVLDFARALFDTIKLIYNFEVICYDQHGRYESDVRDA